MYWVCRSPGEWVLKMINNFRKMLDEDEKSDKIQKIIFLQPLTTNNSGRPRITYGRIDGL